MRMNKKNLTRISVIAIVVVSLVLLSVSAISYFKLKGSDDEGTTNSSSYEVSYETMSRLSEGTILTFGDLNKEPLTLIVDPSELSREKILVNGKPSDLLLAVKDKKIRLNLYLSPSDESRSKGVNSVIQAATCRIGSDKSSTNIFTLVGLVNAAENIDGTEDLEQAAKKIGAKGDLKCPPTANESYVSTANNAKHFMNAFSMEKPGALISGGGRINDFSLLKSNWVSGAINGINAKDLIEIPSEGN